MSTGGAVFAHPAREWIIPPPDGVASRALIDTLGISPLTAAVLVARGAQTFDEAGAALNQEGGTCPDPFLLSGMEHAVDRLRQAVVNRERIVVYGDYDVDGACATALYLGLFNALGHSAEFYIPQRLKEGYGLNLDAVRRIAAAGTSLLITADCGTTSHGEIAAAHSLGIDVIVTDHHLTSDRLPDAVAILNPCKAESGYPFPGLCSGGLAYKVATAYAIKHGTPGWDPDSQLDLVALSTIADVAPLQDENRRFVHRGLRAMSTSERPGLQALKTVAGVDGECTVGTVGYTLAPRINAAGRLGDAADAVRLLLTQEPEEARALAGLLDRMNRERQQIEERLLSEAIEMVEKKRTTEASHAIVLASRSWHPGVVGIAASRIVERYHRPAVLIALNESGLGRGSARSLPGINICDAIAHGREHLEGFGGHAAAAGLSIREERIPAFRACFEAAIEELGRGLPCPRLRCDAELELSGLLPKMVRELARLGPFGAGNPEPTLVFRRLRVTSAKMIGQHHLKLTVRGRQGPVMHAIGFGMGSLESRGCSMEAPVDLACALDINSYNGTEAVQFRLKDLRPS